MQKNARTLRSFEMNICPTLQKMNKKMILFKYFWVNRSFYVSERVIHSEKMSDSLELLFCHEQLEHFAHSCSFLVSDLSELLMVAHFWWATCAIHSQLLFCHEWSEQIAHSCSLKWVILSKRANSQPWWFP